MASPPSTSYPVGGARNQKRARPGDLHASDPAPSALDFHHEDGEDDDDDEDGGEEGDKPPKKMDKKAGRRKIKIEFIQDKSRRHITFSKRKAGIMKKAYELSTLTGTQVLLLVVSETGLVYTFTTAKLQPLVTQPEGKNLIQACLNAPHGAIPTGIPPTPSNPQLPSAPSTRSVTGRNAVGGLAIGAGEDMDDDNGAGDDPSASKPRQRRRTSSTTSAPGGLHHPRLSSSVHSPPLSPGLPDGHPSPDASISPTTSNHSPTMPTTLPPSRNYTTSSNTGNDMYRTSVGHHQQHHHPQHHHHQSQQHQQQQQQMMYHPSYTTSNNPQHSSGPAGGGLGYPQQSTQPQPGGGYWGQAQAQAQLHAHAGVHGGRR